jgi:hypothetical protein
VRSADRKLGGSVCSVLKTELQAVLKGAGRLAPSLELDDEDRAFIEKWANEYTDSKHQCLWEKIEADAREQGGRLGLGSNTTGIFRSLILYVVEARHHANGMRDGDKPFEDRGANRKHLNHLADAADALAEYYHDRDEDFLSVREVLMPLLESVELRLIAKDRLMTISTLPLPAYELIPPSARQLQKLYERQAKRLHRKAGEEPVPTRSSRKRRYRVRNAFVHRIVEYLGDLCGATADGMPHRKVIAVLATINFPDDAMDDEDVRRVLVARRR